MNRKGSSLEGNRVRHETAYLKVMQRAQKEGRTVFFMQEQKELTDYGA